MKTPRVLLERMKVYRRVPKAFWNKDCNEALYKSFARFPIKNSHWQYEVIEYQGHEFLLDSIQEVAYDAQGRSIHFFRESQDEIEETTTVYIPAADGKTVEVHVCSNGRVTIGSSDCDGSPADDPYCHWIVDGNERGLTEREWTDAQKRYMELEERLVWGDGECNMTVEEEEQAREFIEKGKNRQVLECNLYGKPLREIHWDCDEVLDYITYEYTYADE
ncbi:MAG: hypothetical protein IJ814_07745 [Paludibacteraceae bacterium]|nr:hypothetical protein [Paludibacteraceae bacterium]